VKVRGDAGTADQRIDLTQDGNKIAGTLKGPRPSGTIEGTVEGNNIKFRVKALVLIDYVGPVDGGSMQGTLTGRDREVGCDTAEIVEDGASTVELILQ